MALEEEKNHLRHDNEKKEMTDHCPYYGRGQRTLNEILINDTSDR